MKYFEEKNALTMKREDIHLIGRHTNLSEKDVATALKEHVYNGEEAWKKFFQLFFITLGVGFTAAGIVFFFAYNWADLHKFAKIGLTEGALVATTLAAIHPKISLTVRNIVLTGASVLVGVLFAVFGQIYQTGANAYDFFLAWTVFVTLWAILSRFPPLWLLYLVLINTTFLLYSLQVAKEWSGVFVCTLLFVVNSAALVFAISRGRHHVPHWFLNIVALAAVSYATIGIIIGIFDDYQILFPVLILATSIAFALGMLHGLKTKNSFYLSVIPLSLIIIVSAFLIRLSNGEAMFLVVCFFIIASVTLSIKSLINIQKKWRNEE